MSPKAFDSVGEDSTGKPHSNEATNLGGGYFNKEYLNHGQPRTLNNYHEMYADAPCEVEEARSEDWHLCQGLLNIFIKPHADRHIITYNKSKIVRSSLGSSRAPYRDAVIDFGSFKETIEIDPSDYGGG